MAFFADHDQFQRAAGPLRASAELPGVDAPTLDRPSARPTGPGTKVRYFGDYELLEEIARGGMGVVYKARQVNLKRIVALKLILAGQLAGPQEVERFHAEAEAAAKLDHPGIVPIFEVGQHEGQHYFSMAFVDGESLARRVAQGVMEPREAASLMKKVAEAIAYAHVEGVIHRDLKPGNILLDKDGTPRVTDFGLAKRVEGESHGLTATGQVLGTPSYMPPEQAQGDNARIGPLADVYSLGAVLYCLLTGRPPFQAASAVETLLQVVARDPVGPRQLNTAVPRDLETIAMKCLEKDPARRYRSAQEFADDLERWLEGKPIRARPTTAVERVLKWANRKPASATVVAMCGLAAALSIAWLVGHEVWRRHFWQENFGGSDFMHELTRVGGDGEDSVLATVCNRLVGKGKAECQTRGFGGNLGMDNAAGLGATFRLRTPGVRPSQVVSEFRREVARLLQQNGCSDNGDRLVAGELLEFTCPYSDGRIRGVVYASSIVPDRFDSDKDNWRFIIVVHEHLVGW
jgi:predicted Ser/Thr protein kinase